MSAYPPKRTSIKSGHLSAFDPKRASPEAVVEIGCLLVRHGGWLALTATRNGSPTLTPSAVQALEGISVRQFASPPFCSTRQNSAAFVAILNRQHSAMRLDGSFGLARISKASTSNFLVFRP